MAADGISPALAIRSSVGVELWQSTGPNHTYALSEQFAKDESKFCRAIEFSPDGRYLAWANGTKVQIATVDNWNVICSLPRPKAFAIKFSPKGTYLVTFEHFSTPKEGSEGVPNFYVYKSDTGEEVYSIIHKKNSEDWTPGWSNDEKLFAIMVGGEAVFFETDGPNGFQKAAKKIGGSRNGELTVAGADSNPHVALYVPGVKDAPSTCKIFRYPALESNQVVASKSFFQADRVEMMWNKRASGMILLTSMDVDSTGASYYGKQSLHYMNTKGDACAVPLSKEGPIHAVEWNPKGNEFCVIYGYMPSKATFFNLKCNPIFEVKEAPRNSIYYSPFGNIVLLAGFGNLRGNVEVWNVAEKKLITTLQAPDSTMLEWCPNGQMFLTATTAPRLRMGNGFKIWHYTGVLLHETPWPTGQELYEVLWQKYNDGVFSEQPISNVKVEGIQPSQPQASKAKYVPPGARGGGIMPSVRSNTESSEKGAIPGLPIGYKVSQGQVKKNRNARRKNNDNSNALTTESNGTNTEATSSNANKRRQRNPERPTRQKPNQTTNLDAANGGTVNENNADNANQQDPEKPRRDRPRNRGRNNRNEATVVTGDPEKDKRIKVIQKKLHDIFVLKSRRDKGDLLEANQISKINLEAELTNELNSLKIVA